MALGKKSNLLVNQPYFPPSPYSNLSNYKVLFPHSHNSYHPSRNFQMATTSATLSTTITKSSISTLSHKKKNVVHITGLSSFGGLKANNTIASLGLPVSTQQSFAKVVSSLKRKSQGQSGGALSSTCNAGAEIFNIVLTMCGLTLVGVAVGFVLLRIEAFVEEAAEA